MNGRYLLDTSVAVALLRNDAAVRSPLVPGRGVCMSITVLGELLFGAARSGKPEESRQRVAELVCRCPVIGHNEQTAENYAQIKAGLASKGRPIPENDIWIAAAAMQYGLTLAARDEHFTCIDGLDFERW
jgi:tRNA(fMet)-specific endonuclease VapC